MKKLLLIMLLFSMGLSAKVRIITFHCNRPHFIELQHKCLKRFMKDEYELIVFNDGRTDKIEQSIRETCDRLGIQCVRFQQEWHLTDPYNWMIKHWLDHYPNLECHHFDPTPHAQVTLESIANQGSIRHCHIIQYAMNNYGYNHDDIVAIMDGDAFIIRDISLKDKLKNLDIIGMTLKRRGIEHLWVPFIAFKPANLPNIKDLRFSATVINNVLHDTGSQLYYYLRDNPSVKSKKYYKEKTDKLARESSKKLKKEGFQDNEIWLIKNLPAPLIVEFDINKSILHFGEGRMDSDWHQVKSQYVTEFIDRITLDKVM